jgi:ABC-type branched-subunit amino acid transport system substrate-binding protein
MRSLTLAVASALVLAACSGGGEPEPAAISLNLPPVEVTTASTAPPSSVAPPAAPWVADMSTCPSSALQPWGATVQVGVVGAFGADVLSLTNAGLVDGVRAYLEAANADQIVPGVTFELVVGSTAIPTERSAAQAAQDLLQQASVDLFVATAGVDATREVTGVAQPACVPHLAPASIEPGLDDPTVAPWSNAGIVAADLEVQAIFDDARDALTLEDGPVRFGLLTAPDTNGDLYRQAVATVAGSELVADIVMPDGALSLDQATLALLVADQPQVLILSPLAAGCAAAVRAVASLIDDNYAPTIYLTRPCANPVTVQLAGSSIAGVRVVRELVDPMTSAAGSNATLDRLLVTVDAAASPFRASPVYATNAVLGWHLAEVAVAAIAQAGDADELTAQTVIEAAHRLDLEASLALGGAITTNGTTDTVGPATLQIVRYDVDGRPMAEGDPRPMRP